MFIDEATLGIVDLEINSDEPQCKEKISSH